MKQRFMQSIAALFAVAVFGAQAQTTIIDTGYTQGEGYADGDLINNADWAAVANTGANAFDVTDAAGTGFIDTTATTVDTNTGNYAYLTAASAGNAVNDQWSGVVDFQLTLSTNTFQDANGDIWKMGLSTAVDTNLVNGATNQLAIRIGTLNNRGRLFIRGDGGTLINIEPEELGWNGTNDVTTDMLRLNWTMRKNRDALVVTNYYTTECSLSNLATGSNYVGEAISAPREALYADTTPYVVMGQSEDRTYNANVDVIDIKIDNLSFTKTAGILGTLIPATVNADSGNQFVNLSWDYVVEAENYDVTQIFGNVTNEIASAITTNGYEVTGLVNGEEYYFIVTANASGVASVDSVPVLGEPNTAVTGPRFDTTFDSADYGDGDIAGQNNWKAHAAQAAPAFNVDSSGAGFAETATFSGDFDANSGNAMIYSKTMSNTVNAAWSGTTVFSLSAAPEPDLYVTNIYDVISGGVTILNGGTNIQQVANLGNNAIFSFGITDDKDVDPLQSSNGGDALVAINTQGDGDVQIGFNLNSFADPGILFSRTEAGWDPEWRDSSSNGVPGFVTEPITLNWKIRKLSVENAYVLSIDATVNGTSITNDPLYIYPGSPQGADSEPDNVWPADVVYFGMVHEAQALEEGAVNVVNVSIDSLSLTHTNDGFEAFAPYNLDAANGNLEIDLTWEGAIDADSFSLWRSDGTDPAVGPYTEITNIAVLTPPFSYTDSGLTDKRSYFYKWVAHYPGSIDSDDSETLVIRALGVLDIAELHYGRSTGIIGSDLAFTRTVDTTIGGVFFSEGNGTDGALMHSSEPSYNEDVSLYGVLQMTTNSSFAQTGIDGNAGGDRILVGKSGTGTYTALIYMKPSAPLDMVAAKHNLFYVRSLLGSQLRFAIRNAGTWYISQDDFKDPAGVTLTDVGTANWAEIEIATSSMTNLMANPADLDYAPVPGLTSVDAVGYYVYDTSAKSAVFEMSVTTGTAENDFDQWANTVSLYNDNADRTLDPDDDGYNNAWEWGLGGNPMDPNDQGYTEDFTSVETGLTNYFVFKHAMKKAPAPDYHLTETYNLQYVGFELLTNETVSTLGNWEGDTDFLTVTHKIPTTDDVKFIQLNIE